MTHGLSGSGLAWHAADSEAVERLKGAFERELAPKGAVAVGLVHRAAVLASRLERAGRQEVAALAIRVASAAADFDADRLDEVDRLMAELIEAPGRSLRRLARMPEGIDRLIATWIGLGDGLDGRGPTWGEGHRAMAEALLGRRPGDFGRSAVGELSGVLLGAGSAAEARDGARAGLRAVIDGAVAGLREARGRLDLEAIAASRAGAPDRALFDPSRGATLARRDEAATERGLARTFRELAAIEDRASPEDRGPGPSEVRDEVESTRRMLARAEAAVAEIDARPGDRAKSGSFGAGVASPPRDPAERARRPDPGRLKRALKDERRGSRGALQAPTAGPR